MVDISAYGTTVVITVGDASFGGGGTQVLINGEDWDYRTAPITVSQVPLARMEIDLNGHPIVVNSRQPVRLTLSLMPGSSGDKKLMDLMYAFRTMSKENEIGELTIKYPRGSKVSFENGCLIDGNVTANISNQGMIEGGKYDFEFSKWSVDSGSFGQDQGNYTNFFAKNTKKLLG